MADDPRDHPLSHVLAAFATDTRAGGPPDDVAASVRQRILDILGICVAAAPLPTSHAVIDHVAEQGGAHQASAVAMAQRVPASQAAFVNGVLAHSLDYDDTHLPSILHPSASVVPAALAVAEVVGASGASLEAAVAVGLEVTVRLGMAGYDRDEGNSLFFERGQHATSICGAIGSAAAAALLLDLDTDGVDDAMGIAVSMASGLLEANRTGGTVKRLHCGWAAHAGVTAAQLAHRGITGPPTVLEGRFGFFEGFIDGHFHPEELTDGLGTSWTVPGIHFKPYPANHFTHTGIDAAIRLRERGIGPDDVVALRLGVASPTVRTIGQPLDVKRTPDTGYQAQFSGPYTIAAALLGGEGLGLGLDDFTDELAVDPVRRALMAKVEVVADERCDERYPDELPGVLTATLANGEEVVEEVWANRGGPARPLSEDELATKFRDNAARGLDEAAATTVERGILGLDDGDGLAPVMAALRSAAR
jgi:2-methylcitrate dehydratase PrpD